MLYRLRKGADLACKGLLGKLVISFDGESRMVIGQDNVRYDMHVLAVLQFHFAYM